MKCPTPTQLRQFLDGIDQQDFGPLGEHIRQCEKCLAALESIDETDFQELVKIVDADLPQFTEEPACQSLANRILESNLITHRRSENTTHSVSEDFFLVPAGAPGQVLGGYRLSEKIGQGGMGVVWRATQLSTSREVALKILSPFGGDEATLKARFEREIELAAGLEHINIASVYEGGESDSRVFYAMQLVDGLQLDRFVDAEQPNLRQIVSLLIPICRGMEYAHGKGVIHRDLKPQNILIDQRGQPFVTDFGLARNLLDGEDLTLTGQVLGTPSYMAPEQIVDPRRVSTAADIYSIGAIMYRMLTGKVPFRGKGTIDTLKQVADAAPTRPSAINSDVDEDLETICLKCLEKGPADRFQSTSHLLDELIRWENGEPILSRPVAWPSRIIKWSKRKPIAAATVAAFLGLSLLSVSLITWKWLDADEQRSIAEANAIFLAAEEAKKSENLYAAHMKVAQEAWESGLPDRARELLDRQRPVDGKPDLRTFEWYYLNSLSRTAQSTPTIELKDKVTAVAAHPVNDQVAISGDNLKIQIWDTKLSKMLSELPGHRGSVSRLIYSPDGKTLVSNDRSSFRVWQHGKGGFELKFESESRQAGLAQIAPDGSCLAFAEQNDVVLLNLESLKQTRLKGHEKWVTDVCFFGDGKALLSSSEDGTVRKWLCDSAFTGQALLSKPSPIRSIEISDDDSTLAFCHGNRLSTLRIQDDDADENELSIFTQTPIRLASLNNDRTFAAILEDEVLFWDFATGQFTGRILTNSPNDHQFCVAETGTHFVMSRSDSSVIVIESDTLETLKVLRGHSNTIYDVSLFPDGSVISGSRDNTVKIWKDLKSDSLLKCRRNTNRLWSLSFSMDSQQLAVAYVDALVVLWDLESGEKQHEISEHQSSVQFVKHSPDKRLLVSAGDDKVIRIWDVKQNKSAGQLVGHKETINSLSFSPDGNKLVSCGNGGQVFVWDMATRKPTAKYESREKKDFWAVTFSADSHSVIFGGRDRAISIWDFETDETPEIVRPLGEDITSLQFSPIGNLFSATSADGKVVVFDFETHSLLHQFTAHSGDAMFAAFSPDGATLASGGREGKVQFWNLKTGEPTISFDADGQHIHCLQFSPDGQRIAAACWDGTARVWTID